MSTTKSERTRNAILQATRELLEQGRLDKWTMGDIAENAGVTRMTVYRYFPTRADLLIGAVRYIDETEQVSKRFEAAKLSASGLEALDTWAKIWADYLPRIAPVARALLAARHHDEAAAKAWDDRMTSLRQGGPLHIAKWLKAEGKLADHLTVNDAADLIWAIASVQVWDALTGIRGWAPAKYQRHLSQTLTRAVANTR
jgi:AcrR family transcriptional regulator